MSASERERNHEESINADSKSKVREIEWDGQKSDSHCYSKTDVKPVQGDVE